MACAVVLLAALAAAVGTARGAPRGPACLEELLDIAATPTHNALLWNSSHRVSNPEWDGRMAADPAFIAFPRSAADVQRCLQCAHRHGVRVAVKGGGHSFGGYSTLPASEGFVINMRFMAAASPVQRDGPGQTATVTAQAGARWRDVYKSFQQSGEEWVVTGGLCPSVGVAGFTMGGGVGPAARLFGLAVDSVQSFTMVAAKGEEVVVANDTQHPDLFWALRGGGGGNFGVVTDLTFRVHPGPRLYSFGEICFPWAQVERLLGAVEKFGAALPRTLNVDMVVDESGSCLWVTAIEPLSTTRAALAPLMAAMAPSVPQKDTLVEWNCWWEGISAFAKEKGYTEFDDLPYYSKNCLINSIPPALASTLANLTDTQPEACGGQHFISFGGKVGEVPANATAFAWRSTAYMLYTSCEYTPSDAASRATAIAFLNRWEAAVAPFCNGGSYVNFIDPLARGHSDARYYGANLPRLLEVKQRWNPLGSSPLRFPLEIGAARSTSVVV